ncbi:PQQ-like beta-propeller repeat protein, partial [bacterium]|nr:PQQ-like beta-propeller repeat protein [bacterium]
MLWSRPLDLPSFAPILYSQGKIFCITADSVINCLDSASGEVLWVDTLNVNALGPKRLNMAVNDAALIVTSINVAHAFDPVHGDRIWESQVQRTAFSIIPVLDDENLYLAEHSNLVARRLQDGEILWRYAVQESQSGVETCVVTSNTIFYPSSTKVHAINKQDGSRLWVNEIIEGARG